VKSMGVLYGSQRLRTGITRVDREQIQGEAVRHLIALGHRRIAHIQGPAVYKCSYDRFLGYRQALEEAGIALDTALIVQGDFTTPGGYAVAERLLSMADRPTAVFAANDQMAYGVMEAAGALGARTRRPGGHRF
jgi:LacI family transcriptional regulator